MELFDVIILTQKEYINPIQKDDYIQNVLLEDELVQNALESLSLKVKRVAWDDEDFDWNSTKFALFRATWDYFHHFDKFMTWLESVSKKTNLLNSAAIINWNIDKHYLFDLHRNGIHVAETYFIEQHTSTTLKDLHKQLGWKETVLKPCVSGGARHTYKLNCENLDEHEQVFQKLISNEAMMLQPFQHNIVDKGEISMMLFNGKYTHAILKIAKSGDFRVQDDFGGSVHNYSPSADEISYAENCVKACSEMPIYARVDIFEDNNGRIALAELELIEPELWFRNHPKAAQVLADAINDKIK